MASIRCRGLPDDVIGEIRVLEINGLDKNLCCGTHVQSTTDLQCIKLLRAERAKQNTRIYFLVGDRVLRMLGDAFDRQIKMTALLSHPPIEHVAEVERYIKTAKDLEKQVKARAAELAELTAAGLKAKIEAGA